MKNDNNVYAELIGKKIKLYREKNNLTQLEMSELIECNRSAISLIEIGEQELSLKNLVKFIELSKFDFNEIFKIECAKYIVLDTSAILNRPQILNVAIECSDGVKIPEIVIKELNYQKDKGNNQARTNANLCMNWINDLKSSSNKIEIIYTKEENGNNDDKIFNAAKEIASKYNTANVYLLAADKDFKFKENGDNKNLRVISPCEFTELFLENDVWNVAKSKRFFDAISRNNLEAAKNLMEKNINIDVNYTDDDFGFTPLIDAVRKDNVEIVDYLLSIPTVDINAVDSKKYVIPAISHAVQKNNIKMVKKLIDNGANVNRPADNMKNPYNTPIMIAAWGGNLEIVKMLFEAGAGINQQDKGNGMTPLMKAVFQNKCDVVEYLLNHNADKNTISYEGKTALDYAYEKNANGKYAKIIELLKNGR